MMRRRSALAGVVSLLSAVFVAGRRGFAAQPVEDKDLVAKAQAQGTVSIYIAMTAEDVQKLVNRFDADYPANRRRTKTRQSVRCGLPGDETPSAALRKRP